MCVLSFLNQTHGSTAGYSLPKQLPSLRRSPTGLIDPDTPKITVSSANRPTNQSGLTTL
jgi:hypothetical protein